MKIHVRSRLVVVGDEARAHIERRLASSLDRFADRVQRVTVSLLDVNGPRGGEDKLCRIEARLRPTGTVFVEEAGADLLTVVDRAADRVGEAVSRALKRGRRSRRGAPPPEGPRPASERVPEGRDAA